jgi:hypothetical protein
MVVALCWASVARAQSDCRVSAPAVSRVRPLEGVCNYLRTREGVVQVAVYDRLTDKTNALSNGSNPQYTASIVKADILAMWLRSYQQQQKKIPEAVPYSIKFIAEQMIELSDNAAATALFHFGGGCDALTKFNSLVPLKATDVACETPTYYGWGNTRTTARDQVALMKVFAYGKPRHVLGEDARAYGLRLMESVDAKQRWGITCGPWGTTCPADGMSSPQPIDGITVALKNGWKTLPTCSQPIPQCPWQVNGTGWVNGEGRDYVLTVLITEDPVGTGDTFGFQYGIETIQGISKLIWGNLA